MIFVTLGSQKFQFNRLLKKIDALIEEGIITEEVFAQVGASDYEPQNYQYVDFMSREAFAEAIEKSDVVITHGGTGSVIGSVKRGKRVIAVPRLATYGEHVDNHQVQLLNQFDELGLIAACYDLEDLPQIYANIYEMDFEQYESNTNRIIESIDEYLTQL